MTWPLYIYIYPYETHLNPKYREMSFAHNLFLNYPGHFEILHRARQYYGCYGQTRFHIVGGVSDILNCTAHHPRTNPQPPDPIPPHPHLPRLPPRPTPTTTHPRPGHIKQ